MSDKKSIITPQEKDFSEWYLDVVKVAELADYGPVKGTMIIRPYGYAIWENIQRIFDGMIKEKGIQNAYFPLFIPESFLKKEKDHVEGFSPELAVVTIAGGEKLTEPIVVRPTSETIIYDTYSRWISSYRDLPYITNQWCNIVRWEKKTKPFLRTSEFLWQEGHSVLATEKEVDEHTMERLDEYRKFIEESLSVPLFVGKKSESEKFAGAAYSTSCEALLKDGKALQSATSHNLGQNFAKPFNIQFETENGTREYGWQSSWGLSTRIIGAIIMTHGDNKGLVLPPAVAPTQAVIIPIFKNDEEKAAVMAEADSIMNKYKGKLRLHLDSRDNLSPGWKFTEWEIKGVPVRIEIGPKDVAEKSVTLIKRTNGDKLSVKTESLDLEATLDQVQSELFETAKKFKEENTYSVSSYDDFKKELEDKKGYYLVDWCAEAECEKEIKNETTATTRVIPFESDVKSGAKCFHCGKNAKTKVYFAKAY
jgi:prolyl-tRNA synthetase